MSLEAPLKIFLLGEYAVLEGGPAVITCLPERYRLVRAPSRGREARWKEGSPVARLAEHARAREVEIPEVEWRSDRPGFGESTAQFALLFYELAPALGLARDWKSALELYRQLTADEPMPPSGADLVAQWLGGTTLVEGSEARPLALDLTSLLVFATGIKVATHEHLRELARREDAPARRLVEPARDAAVALMRVVGKPAGESLVRQARALGAALDGYAAALAREQLELPETREHREALRALPFVVGVKGAGALQADALVVLVEPGASREPVIEAARARGLELVRDGIGFPPKGVA
jgi:hypothetical protein